MPAPKRTHQSDSGSLFKQHRSGPAAAPCSGALQRHQDARPKVHTALTAALSSSGTLQPAALACPLQSGTHHWQQHFQAVAPCSQRHKHARPKMHTPVYSSTLKQHPHPAAAPACPLQSAHTHNSDGSTLKQHPAAAPACPKRRHATPPILEVRTPIASLSGDKASKAAKASPIGRAATPKFKPRSPWSRRKQVDPELFLHLEA